MEQPAAPMALDTEGGQQRRKAMARFAVLRPVLDDEVPLTFAARAAGVPLRTAQRWLAGSLSHARPVRLGASHPLGRGRSTDAGRSRRPDRGNGAQAAARVSAATIHRRVAEAARAKGWRAPSYSTVHAIIARLEPGMVALAHDGIAGFRDRYELIHRHRAAAPNAVWQADHTMLDLLILDERGKPARPWLTTVLDDHSRAVAGYAVFLGAPSALNTCLALRQAIWRKSEAAWPVCGIPDMLYVDHGSDFTSLHLEQVSAALRFQVTYSAVGRPQGRGKIERLFGTINTKLLPELPGWLSGGKAAAAPRLSLAELDRAIGAFVSGIYHVRPHSETGQTPLDAWRGDGFLPRLPDNLEDLDLLLIMHAKARTVQRDGVRFQGLRYVSPTLAGYIRESVTIRYDPRDLSEIRVFHRGRFLCRAVSEEHAGNTVTLKDIEAARRAHRQALRNGINERIARVADFLPVAGASSGAAKPGSPARPTRSKLKIYEEDGT